MSFQGYLVNVNNVPQVVYPNTNPVHKNGHSQFWFYLNGKAVLATRNNNELAYKATVKN